MKVDPSELVDLVLRHARKVAADLPEKDQADLNADSGLYGQGSRFDSLALVNLVVAIEREVDDRYGMAITLADERAMSQPENPFSTVAALSRYVGLLLSEA